MGKKIPEKARKVSKSEKMNDYDEKRGVVGWETWDLSGLMGRCGQASSDPNTREVGGTYKAVY